MRGELFYTLKEARAAAQAPSTAGPGQWYARLMMRAPSNSIAILALSSAVIAPAILGCSSDGASPPAPVEAIFGPPLATMLTPYPSNRYTLPDPSSPTGLRVNVSSETTADSLITVYGPLLEQLNGMDGFSTSGGVIVSFSAPIDIRGITTDERADPPILDTPLDAEGYTKPGAPLVLVNVDPASPEHGKAHGLVPRWWAQAKDSYYTSDEFTLIAQPATPLLPGTRYLFAVTKSLRGEGGAPIARSADTERLLGGEAEGAYEEEVLAGVDEVKWSRGVRRDDIVLATSFTTATVLTTTIEMAKRARASAAPKLVDPWTVETPMQSDGRVRFRATYETPEYRKAAPDGKWAIEEGGAPVLQKKVPLEVFLAFSDATKPGPRPVVLYGHGLGGDKDGCWGTAGRLADINAAVVAIDSPEHGSRSSMPDDLLASTFGFFGIDQATHAFDIGRARDNFRQMASDQLELVRFLGSLGSLDLLPVGAPDGVPDLDVSRLLYIGHSFGSVQGPTALALAPEIKQAVWNVGGDGLMTLLRDSGTFSLLVNALKPEGTSDGALARFFAVTQAIVDPGDPLNYARFGTQEALPGVTGWSARDVLLQEVIDDGIVPNSTSEALARAAGLALVDPIRPVSGLASTPAPVKGNLASGATGAMSQFDRIEGDKIAVHGDLIFSPEARAQYVEFFKTGLAGEHATVIGPYPK